MNMRLWTVSKWINHWSLICDLATLLCTHTDTHTHKIALWIKWNHLNCMLILQIELYCNQRTLNVCVLQGKEDKTHTHRSSSKYNCNYFKLLKWPTAVLFFFPRARPLSISFARPYFDAYCIYFDALLCIAQQQQHRLKLSFIFKPKFHWMKR